MSIRRKFLAIPAILLTAAGLTDITAVKHVFGVTDSNRRYLAAKQDWGHRLTSADIEEG